MSVTLPATLFLYCDIETIPSQDPSIRAEIKDRHDVPAVDLSLIRAAANLTDPDKIEADILKRRLKAMDDYDAAHIKAKAAAEEEYRKTALDATTGHIACICLALGDGQVLNAVNVPLHGFAEVEVPLGEVLVGERRMLEVFFFELEAMLSQLARDAAEAEWAKLEAKVARAIEAGYTKLMPPEGREAWVRRQCVRLTRTPTVVAHHAQFDVRYVWQRAIILGVAVPAWWPIDATPWDSDRVDDTMLAWAGAKGTIGLDRLCRALGIPGKPDSIDGSKVWDAVRQGRIGDVVSYCDGDVERLRAVHRRIRGIVAVEPPAIADTEALFEAAEAAADRDQQAEIDAMPAWSDVQEPHYARGFNADGGSYDATNNE